MPSSPGLGVLFTVTSEPRTLVNPLFVFKHLEPLCPRQSVSTPAAGEQARLRRAAACGRGTKSETTDVGRGGESGSVCMASSLSVQHPIAVCQASPHLFMTEKVLDRFLESRCLQRTCFGVL